MARLQVSRGLRSGKLDVVMLNERELAQIVADGAALLATLARGRESC